jgi:hypothetical protein
MELEADGLGGAWAVVAAFLAAVPLAAASVLAALHAWRFLRLARAAERVGKNDVAPPVLRDGRAVLSGTVEPLEGDEPPVRLEVAFRARNYTVKSKPQHEWKEVSRRLVARPFALVLPGGERVRVEPAGAVALSDTLAWVAGEGPMARFGVATVRGGERVSIGGHLARENDPGSPGGGYRAGGKGWLLRATPDAPLAVASAESAPLVASYGRGLRVVAIVCAAVWALLNGVWLAPFYFTSAFGEPVTARIERLDAFPYRATKRAPLQYAYTVYASYERPGGGRVSLSGAVDPWTGRVPPARAVGAPVKFRVVPWFPVLHQIGSRPYVPVRIWMAGPFIITILLPLIVLAVVHQHRPWFLKRELSYSGTGHVS